LAPATAVHDVSSALAFGSHIVTWTATDGRGNSATATQVVNIVDTTPPSVTAPASITRSTHAGMCAWTGNIGNAIASDLCAVSSTVATLSATPVVASTAFASSTSGGGTSHVVTWTATDTSGNTAVATQSVTVVDTESRL
jgi:hypothetical protein